MKNWIVNNFWIKAISLMLAVITWIYVNGELTKQKLIRSKFYKPSTIEPAKNQPTSGNKGYITEKN